MNIRQCFFSMHKKIERSLPAQAYVNGDYIVMQRRTGLHYCAQHASAIAFSCKEKNFWNDMLPPAILCAACLCNCIFMSGENFCIGMVPIDLLYFLYTKEFWNCICYNRSNIPCHLTRGSFLKSSVWHTSFIDSIWPEILLPEILSILWSLTNFFHLQYLTRNSFARNSVYCVVWQNSFINCIWPEILLLKSVFLK